MPTNITQIEDAAGGRIILRVEGEMFRDDALLIERIGRDLLVKSDYKIAIDVADLDLLDSESASVLQRLGKEEGFELIGMEIFLQAAINEAEKH